MGYPLKSNIPSESKVYYTTIVVKLIENLLKLQYFRQVAGNTCSGIPPLEIFNKLNTYIYIYHRYKDSFLYIDDIYTCKSMINVIVITLVITIDLNQQTVIAT